MSKISNLVGKTTRGNDSIKKKTVVLGIIFGLLIGGGLFLVAYHITEPIVDNYFSQTEIGLICEFYDEQVNKTETSVYFVGSSLMATAANAPETDNILLSRGYNITTYNLFVGADTPELRALQTEMIIKSKPSLIIYGISYRDLEISGLEEEQVLLSRNYFTPNSELLDLYTKEEIELLTANPLYKKGYLFRSLKSLVSKQSAFNYVKVPIGPSLAKNADKQKDDEKIRMRTLDPENPWRPIVTNETTQAKKSLLYMLNKFKDAGIPVVVVNLPIHPYLSEQITDESRNNFSMFMNNSNITWIDLEKMYDGNHFRDYIHTTWNGSIEFAPVMADLIIKEVESNAIHYT